MVQFFRAPRMPRAQLHTPMQEYDGNWRPDRSDFGGYLVSQGKKFSEPTAINDGKRLAPVSDKEHQIRWSPLGATRFDM